MPDAPEATNPSAAPAPAADPSNAPAPTPAPTPESAPFHASFEDKALGEWAAAKGWQNPEAVVKSAQNLEKLIGAPADQVLRLPQNGDVDGWKAVHQRLGAPAEPTGYDMRVDQEDPAAAAYGEHMAKAFHEAGLTTAQADAILEAGDAFLQQHGEGQAEEYELTVQAAEQELRKEWGNGYDTQIAVGRNAAQRLGFTEEMIDGLEQAVGYAETMKMMAQIGQRLGEDKYVTGSQDGASTSVFTPAQATAAWNDFRSDPNNVAALMDKSHPGHARALQRKAEIFNVMHPQEN